MVPPRICRSGHLGAGGGLTVSKDNWLHGFMVNLGCNQILILRMVPDMHVMKIVEESDLVVLPNLIFSWFDDFHFQGIQNAY